MSKYIVKISCEMFSYEVGKDDVAKIELTEHGSADTTIYRVSDADGELILHAGLLVPHEIEYAVSEQTNWEQIIFDF